MQDMLGVISFLAMLRMRNQSHFFPALVQQRRSPLLMIRRPLATATSFDPLLRQGCAAVGALGLPCHAAMSLDVDDSLVIGPGLPGGGADVRDPLRIEEDALDLLERLVGRFREHEEDVYEHGGEEDAEEDINLPSDVDKSGGHKVRKGEVESPRSH